MKVKVCGVTRLSDALLASDLGASAIGFVFWERSPRAVDPESAARIARRLPADVAPVGVFVDAAPTWVRGVVGQVGLAAVQLHGGEAVEDWRGLPARVIKALAVRSQSDVEAALRLPAHVTVLLDGHDPVRRGGTGRTVDWTLAAAVARRRRTFLAGGLRPENVSAAIAAVAPYGVDASSGLEAAPGVKAPARLRAFFAAVRATAAGVPAAEQAATGATGRRVDEIDG